MYNLNYCRMYFVFSEKKKWKCRNVDPLKNNLYNTVGPIYRFCDEEIVSEEGRYVPSCLDGSPTLIAIKLQTYQDKTSKRFFPRII